MRSSDTKKVTPVGPQKEGVRVWASSRKEKDDDNELVGKKAPGGEIV